MLVTFSDDKNSPIESRLFNEEQKTEFVFISEYCLELFISHFVISLTHEQWNILRSYIPQKFPVSIDYKEEDLLHMSENEFNLKFKEQPFSALYKEEFNKLTSYLKETYPELYKQITNLPALKDLNVYTFYY